MKYMKQIMYYHNDPDGYGCAASFLLKYPNLELQACNYGDEIKPVSDYDLVIVADYCFDQETMTHLNKQNKEFIWIDHHKTSIERTQGDFKGVQDTTKAASQLCWEYLNPNTDLPKLLLHIAEDDMWQFNHKETEGFMLYLDTLLTKDKEPHILKDIIENWNEQDYEQAYEKGFLLENYRNSVIKEQGTRSVKDTFQGIPAMIIFTNSNISHLGHHVLEVNSDIDIAVMINYKNNNEGKKIFKYSLRSRNQGVNVAELCAKFGGGGHPQAAGFDSETLILN